MNEFSFEFIYLLKYIVNTTALRDIYEDSLVSSARFQQVGGLLGPPRLPLLQRDIRIRHLWL